MRFVPVVVSTGASGGRVKLPSSESPLETQTPGFRADHSEIILSALQWCKKKIGSKAVFNMENSYFWMNIYNKWVMGLTSNGRIRHLSTDGAMNTVMNGFEAVTGAATISDSVVAERRPGVDTCKHTVGARRNIILRRTQNPTRLRRSVRFGHSYSKSKLTL